MTPHETAPPPVCTGNCHPSKMAMTQDVSPAKESDQTPTGVGPVVGLREAADHVGMSLYTLRDWIKAGKVPAYRLGQRWRVRIADLEALLVPSGTS